MTELDEADVVNANADADAAAAAIRAEVLSLDPGTAASEWEAELRRIVRGRRQRMAAVEAAQAEKKRLIEACDSIIREAESDLRSFDWVWESRAKTLVACLTQSGKSKSVKTPWGTAGFRTQPARCHVFDQEKLIEAWGDHQVPAGLVKTETVWKVDAAGVQRHFASTGEVLPGCEVKEAEEAFYVR